jgi:hypothetical protein
MLYSKSRRSYRLPMYIRLSGDLVIVSTYFNHRFENDLAEQEAGSLLVTCELHLILRLVIMELTTNLFRVTYGPSPSEL